MLHPVILCGGSGTRLWPASTPERPKAFLALTGERSLLQETALRATAIAGAAPPRLVVAARHAGLAREEVAAMGPVGAVLAEPGGRGSAPAIAAALLELRAADPEAVALVVACDHHVPDTQAFARGVADALPAAQDGALVTFGVRPDRASDAYGHILPGAPLSGAVRRIERFVEKPDMATARGLLDAGCLWNSGNFLFRADVMLGEIAAREPALLEAARAGLAGARRDGGITLLGDAFLSAPDLSIDVAVMEKTDRAAVLPVDYAWSDLGAWDAVLAVLPRDGAGNALAGRAAAIDSEGCLIRAAPGVEIAAIGLKNIAVVVEDGRILVVDLAKAQQVKAVASALKKH